MSLLNLRQKSAIIQLLDALETLINHVEEYARLEEQKQKKKKCMG